MRAIIVATIALACAACGVPADHEPAPADQAAAAQALFAGLPGVQARCERGAALPQAITPIRANAHRLDLALRVQRPTAQRAPDFLAVQLSLSNVRVGALDGALSVAAQGLDPITAGLNGYGTLIISTADGTQDLASFDLFGRCGAFSVDTIVPFDGDAPSEVQVEWRLPEGHATRTVVEVW